MKPAKRLLGVNGVHRRQAARKAEGDQGSNSLAAADSLLFGGAVRRSLTKQVFAKKIQRLISIIRVLVDQEQKSR